MKKIITVVMAIVMLALTAVAFAEGSTATGAMNGMPSQGQMQNGSMMGGPNGNGQPPTGQMPSGEKPADLPELPSGEKPADLPELPSGEKPVMIDFDAMVTKGVISQETCDKIKTYMEEHKPADLPDGQPTGNIPEMSGEKPVDGQTPPEKPEGEKPADAPGMGGGLLADLLKDGIITQAEYDALIAALTSEEA